MHNKLVEREVQAQLEIIRVLASHDIVGKLLILKSVRLLIKANSLVPGVLEKLCK